MGEVRRGAWRGAVVKLLLLTPLLLLTLLKDSSLCGTAAVAWFSFTLDGLRQGAPGSGDRGWVGGPGKEGQRGRLLQTGQVSMEFRIHDVKQAQRSGMNFRFPPCRCAARRPSWRGSPQTPALGRSLRGWHAKRVARSRVHHCRQLRLRLEKTGVHTRATVRCGHPLCEVLLF